MDSKTRKMLNLLRNKRSREGLSLRALSSQIGVSFSTLSRLEKKENIKEPDANTKASILNWLGKEAEDAGISFSEMALVHFRAKKNINSKTVECLLRIADKAKQQFGKN